MRGQAEKRSVNVSEMKLKLNCLLNSVRPRGSGDPVLWVQGSANLNSSHFSLTVSQTSGGRCCALSPLAAGESHMGIWAVLQPATISILKISPCWGGIDAGLCFDFRGLGGPARGERAARSAGASVHR